jgi:hypothetical protein
MVKRIIPGYGEEFLRREGLKPEIAAWEDGLRTDTGPGNFEWWYFDAHFGDGSTAVMIYATKPLLLRGNSLTPMVTLTITRPDGVRLNAPPLLYPPSQFESARDSCQVRIGPSRVSGNLHSYKLHTEGDKDWAADLVFTDSAPPWRPGAGKIYYDEALSRHFAWLVSIPYGKVEGALTYDGKTHPVRAPLIRCKRSGVRSRQVFSWGLCGHHFTLQFGFLPASLCIGLFGSGCTLGLPKHKRTYSTYQFKSHFIFKFQEEYQS